MRWDDVNVELLLGQNPHVLVSFPVMRGQSSHLIEDFVQVMLDFLCNYNLLLKKIQVTHPCEYCPVLDLLSSRISLLKIADDDLMDLKS